MLLLLSTTTLAMSVSIVAVSANPSRDFLSTTWANGEYNCALPAGYSELSVICAEALNAVSEINNTHTVRGTVTRSVDGNTYIQRVNQSNGQLDSILLKNSGSYSPGNVLDISGGKLFKEDGVPYMNATGATVTVAFPTNTTGYEAIEYDSVTNFKNNAFSRDTYNYSHFVKVDNALVEYEIGADELAIISDFSSRSNHIYVEPASNEIKATLEGYHTSSTALSLTGLLYKNGEHDVLRIVQKSDISIYNYNLRNPQDTTILQAWNWNLTNIQNNLDNIRNAGFKTIQISPLQPQTRDSSATAWPDQWWKLYQPAGFKVSDSYGENVLGDKEQLISLTAAAQQRGISIIVDVVCNHLAGTDTANFQSYVQTYEPDIYNGNLTHNYKNNHSKIDDSQEGTVRGSVGGYPDLDTSNSKVQERVLSLLKEYLDCGVRGFRFDAAKHIETPSDGNYASNFWSNVVWAANEYAENKYGFTPYNYGEILGAGNDRNTNWYLPYMSVSEGNARKYINAVNSKNVYGFDDGFGYDITAEHIVVWPESHDDYQNESKSGNVTDQNKINKAYAIVASRHNAASLFLARPTDRNTNMGAIGSNAYKSTVVSACNIFHNELVYASEYIKRENGYFINVRASGDRNGAMIVNVGESGPGTINLNVADNFGIPDGNYIDLTNGQTVNVSSGYVTANFGDDGVMALLKVNKTGDEISEGFGLKFGSGKTILAIDTGTQDYGGRHQYKIISQTFKKDETFTLYDFKTKAQWVIDIDSYSFGAAGDMNVVDSYVTKGANSYTVKQDFTTDVYIKIKDKDDQIYFDTAGIKIDKNSVNLLPSGSDTVEVSNYVGSYSASSSDTEVATVSKNGNALTITAVAVGSATISVTDGVVTREISVTVAELPSTYTYTGTWTVGWIWSDQAVVLIWAWGGTYSGGTWVAVDSSTANSISFEVARNSGMNGFKLVRFPKGTTPATANWDNKYNETSNNASISSGVYSYSFNW